MGRIVSLLVLSCLSSIAYGRVYDRCDLARELLRLGAPRQQISTWVCIAQHESNFDTSAIGPPNTDNSRDHGIFQINDRYWCSPPGTGCGIDCASLRRDDISAAWRCAETVFEETRRLKGNGFAAWSVYRPYCSGDTSSYVDGCFGQGGHRTNLLQNYLVLPLYAAASCWSHKGPAE